MRKKILTAQILVVIFVLLLTSLAICSNWPFELFPANLHVHTILSNKSALAGDNIFSTITAPQEDHDHLLSDTPEETCDLAQRIGLKILGFSDHDTGLTYGEWLYLGQALDQKRSTSFIPLRGFEWTHDIHVNVFGCNEYTDIASFPDFCDWLVRHPDIIAQINHPCDGRLKDEHLDYIACRPELVKIFSLIEVGSGPAIRYQSLEVGELKMQLAIQKGLIVGPTNNIDNFGSLKEAGARRHHTGIWVNHNSLLSLEQNVLQALRDRRVFASEDKEFSLKYWAIRKGDQKIYYLGDIITSANRPQRPSPEIKVKVKLRVISHNAPILIFGDDSKKRKKYDYYIAVTWDSQPDAKEYRIYRNGQFIATVRGNEYRDHIKGVPGETVNYYISPVGLKEDSFSKEQLTVFIELNDSDEPVGEVRLISVKTNGVSSITFNSNSCLNRNYSTSYSFRPSSEQLAYYIKVIQKDGDRIISAPIFIRWK